MIDPSVVEKYITLSVVDGLFLDGLITKLDYDQILKELQG